MEGGGPVKCRWIPLRFDGDARGLKYPAGRLRVDGGGVHIAILAAGIEHLVVVDFGTGKRVIAVVVELFEKVDQLGVEPRPGIRLGFGGGGDWKQPWCVAGKRRSRRSMRDVDGCGGADGGADG